MGVHQLVHWPTGGETQLVNLALLYRAHHRLVHEGGYSMRLHDDAWVQFFRPDGTEVPAHPPVDSVPEAMVDDHRRRWALDPEEWAHWVDPLDLDLCVWLLYQEERAPAGPLDRDEADKMGETGVGLDVQPVT